MKLSLSRCYPYYSVTPGALPAPGPSNLPGALTQGPPDEELAEPRPLCTLKGFRASKPPPSQAAVGPAQRMPGSTRSSTARPGPARLRPAAARRPLGPARTLEGGSSPRRKGVRGRCAWQQGSRGAPPPCTFETSGGHRLLGSSITEVPIRAWWVGKWGEESENVWGWKGLQQ